MELKFDNYFLRTPEKSDIDSIVKYADNFNISKLLRDRFPYPYTRSDAISWLDYLANESSEIALAISNSTELIGVIGAIPGNDVNRFTAEIGYWLGEPFWNKGITTKAVKTFCNYLFTEYQFNHLTASIFEGNTGSVKVITKAGFNLEGVLRKNVFKDNRFLDQYIYGLLKEDFNNG